MTALLGILWCLVSMWRFGSVCNVVGRINDVNQRQARFRQNVVSDAIQIYTETNADSLNC